MIPYNMSAGYRLACPASGGKSRGIALKNKGKTHACKKKRFPLLS
jgi:hypothetical protein